MQTHKYKLLTAIKTLINNEWHYGLIISASIFKKKRRKGYRKKNGQPVYLITGYGPPIYETDIFQISNEEYKINMETFQKLYSSKRSFQEDYHLENGNYINICCRCNHEFLGYKRRVLCKICSNLKHSLIIDIETTKNILSHFNELEKHGYKIKKIQTPEELAINENKLH